MFTLLLATFAFAQETDFSETDKEGEAAEAPEAHLGAELGGQYTTGNTEFYLLTGGMNGSYKWARSKVGTVLGANIGRSRVDADGSGTLDDAERGVAMKQTAQKYFIDARYDFYLSDHDSLYFLGGALHDYYAGLSLRTHEQVGYSRTLIGTDETTLLAELGVDDAQEWQLVDGVRGEMIHIFAGRAMVNFTHKFNENVGIEESIEVYENFLDTADLRLYNKAAVTTKLSDMFSLRFGNQITFDNKPVEGFRKLDQTTTVTLVASIL